MSADYQSCYEQLNVASGISWEELNNHYRKLVQVWHPDRYSGSNPLAAEKTFIELTKAFSELRDYYRSHDELPQTGPVRGFVDQSHPDNAQKGVYNTPVIDATAASFTHQTNTSNRKTTFWDLVPFSRRSFIQAFCLLFVAFGLVFLFWNMENKNRQKLLDESRAVKSSTPPQSLKFNPDFMAIPTSSEVPKDPASDL